MSRLWRNIDIKNSWWEGTTDVHKLMYNLSNKWNSVSKIGMIELSLNWSNVCYMEKDLPRDMASFIPINTLTRHIKLSLSIYYTAILEILLDLAFRIMTKKIPRIYTVIHPNKQKYRVYQTVVNYIQLCSVVKYRTTIAKIPLVLQLDIVCSYVYVIY